MERDWHSFDVLHLPPHCENLEVEVERVLPYGGVECQTLRAYYDAMLSEFRNSWGIVRGTVLRWRLVE